MFDRDEIFVRYPALEICREDMEKALALLIDCAKADGKILVCGNGGSASDSEHIVGELLKSFQKHRAVDSKTAEGLLAFGDDGKYVLEHLEGALPAVSLISQNAVLTAFANDNAWETAMAQQLYGLGKSEDCLLALSTSGNSKNCVYAALVAKAKGMKTVALTGVGGGRLCEVCDECVCVPEKETYKIQELHLPIYHYLCAEVEKHFFI